MATAGKRNSMSESRNDGYFEERLHTMGHDAIAISLVDFRWNKEEILP